MPSPSDGGRRLLNSVSILCASQQVKYNHHNNQPTMFELKFTQSINRLNWDPIHPGSRCPPQQTTKRTSYKTPLPYTPPRATSNRVALLLLFMSIAY